jgi:hypothetical protein
MRIPAVLLAVAAFAALPAAASAAPWSAPRSVTVNGQAREPVVALGGPDAAAVAYVRHFDGADRVEVRQGTVASLRTPAILARDARHGFDSPALTYSGPSAVVVWRQFQQPDTRVLALSSVSSRGVASGPSVLTGPPNSYEPTFVGPSALTFWRRQAAYVRTIADGRPLVTTRLPAGAAFEARVAQLPDGTRVAVWPNGGAIYAATQAPGAPAFGAALRLSAPGGFSRSPRIVVTPDGHAIAVWTQSNGTGRALMSAGAPPGGAFGAPIELQPPSAQVLTAQAIATTNDEVLVTFVSARADNPAGPLQALQLSPDGHAVTPVLTLTAPGERTRDAALAIDNSGGYAAWVVAGNGVRHRVRVVRVAPGGIVGTVRTVSGSDSAISTPPAFAMTSSGRAMIAYATRGNQIRLVTRRSG